MSEELVTLPHSGVRVPHTDLHVTAARSLPGTDGEMLNATLRLRTRVVGYLLNEGRGGATFFQPKGASFGWRDLEAFVAACRNPAGEPVPESTCSTCWSTSTEPPATSPPPPAPTEPRCGCAPPGTG